FFFMLFSFSTLLSFPAFSRTFGRAKIIRPASGEGGARRVANSARASARQGAHIPVECGTAVWLLTTPHHPQWTGCRPADTTIGSAPPRGSPRRGTAVVGARGGRTPL